MLFPFSCIPYIKGGSYITWIFLEIINPLKALAMPWLVHVKLNVQYQFREFWKPKFGSDYAIFFHSFCCGFPWVPINMQWPHGNKKLKHIKWNNRQVLKPFKIICLNNWFKIKIFHIVGIEGFESGVGVRAKIEGSRKCKRKFARESKVLGMGRKSVWGQRVLEL
jgi:hypothetical protein